MNINEFIAPVILGVSGYILLQLVNLKVQVAKILSHLEMQDERDGEYRSHVQHEINHIRTEVKDIWEQLRETK